VYSNFLRVLQSYKDGALTIEAVKDEIAHLFEGHPTLLHQFSIFLPPPASGLKLKKKEKTERKLEAMQANLTRLNDLAGEVRRQLKPLSQQAETARQAQGIASVVRDAKARLMAAEVVALLNGLDQTSQSEADRKAERNILQQQLDENNQRLAELENQQMSSEVEVARSLAFAFDTVTEKFRTMLAIANQRVALLTSQKTLTASQVDPAAIEADAKAADSSVVELTVCEGVTT
jgi:chromosome segregation protein